MGEEVESPPNVRVPVVVIVPPRIGHVVAMDVTVPEPLPPPTQVPPIAKQPVVRLMPEPKVLVAVALMLMVFAPVLPSERSVPGLVVPMPTLPEVSMTALTVLLVPK